MTSRAAVDRLPAAGRTLVNMAKRDMDALVGMLDLSSPEAARDAVLEIMPQLVREYGEIASTAAAEWYEDIRAAAGVTTRHTTALSGGADMAQVEASARYATGHLFGENPLAMTGLLGGMLQRYIMYGMRDTVRRNTASDRARPRYARVPSGAKTCAFCEMLASRGFVYHSEASSGDAARKGFGDDFHDDCDCQVVPEFDRDQHHIDGFDPDAMYDRYRRARDKAGSGDQSDILKALRRLCPENFTDGIQPE